MVCGVVYKNESSALSIQNRPYFENIWPDKVKQVNQSVLISEAVNAKGHVLHSRAGSLREYFNVNLSSQVNPPT